jgi:hypothetical protein
MSHAKRMVLVDEKLFDQYRHSWKQPADVASKTVLDDKLDSQLEEKLPDDIKAKEFQRLLYRFLHATRDIPTQHPLSLNGSMQVPKRTTRKSTRKVKKVKWEGFYG